MWPFHEHFMITSLETASTENSEYQQHNNFACVINGDCLWQRYWCFTASYISWSYWCLNICSVGVVFSISVCTMIKLPVICAQIWQCKFQRFFQMSFGIMKIITALSSLWSIYEVVLIPYSLNTLVHVSIYCFISVQS